jgi:hypothetical protein
MTLEQSVKVLSHLLDVVINCLLLIYGVVLIDKVVKLFLSGL